MEFWRGAVSKRREKPEGGTKKKKRGYTLIFFLSVCKIEKGVSKIRSSNPERTYVVSGPCPKQKRKNCAMGRRKRG